MNYNKDIKWYSTIKTKMAASLILIITTLTVSAGLFSYSYIKNYETNRLTNFINLSANRLAKSLETPMWNIDRDQVSALVNTEMEEKTIVGIVIADEGNERVFLSKARGKSGNVIDFSGDFSNNYIRTSRSIIHEEKIIGSINIFVTRQYLNEVLTGFALSVAVLVIVLALATFLLMHFLLNKIVVSPLLLLADSANATSLGELNQTFHLSSKDEIGYLSESFRKMQASLRIAMNRLSDLKESETVKRSTFSDQALARFSQEINATGHVPSLINIFKTAAASNTVPDDLIAVAWKQWNQYNGRE